jgi:lysophospholipase L1-like esterase
MLKKDAWRSQNVNKKRFTLFFGFVLLVVNGMKAQSFIPFDQRFSFIQYDENKIVLPGDSLDFLQFLRKFDKLNGLGKGKLQVVHFGGSHVQADIWTGRIRTHFNTFLNQKLAARGLIFPHKVVKTNGSATYEITYQKAWEGLRNIKLTSSENMGLMGWKATAKDSGQTFTVQLKTDAHTQYVFDKLQVFHDTGWKAFSFTVSVRDSIFKPTFNSNCQCSEVLLPFIATDFTFTVHKEDSLQESFVLYGINTQIQSTGFVYHNIGVNGASVPSYLNSNLLEQQIAQIKPDLVVFSIGINDAFSSDFTRQGFESNYDELIRRIKKQMPGVAILLTTNTDSYKTIKKRQYKNYTGNDVRTAMYNLAIKHGAAVWDMYSVMGGLGSIELWRRNGLAQKDLIHLTFNGYKYMGDLFFDAFLKRYEAFVASPLANLQYE